ncbi:hypothetical protein ElyMa_006826800 [Elysia marginata]|uniref:Uncharacterized protein n=1 Tax=Elysia marginata TaxID=1093978 RepID=A0AAV4J832_9GAST|nr:hypothetical protein ElyMa_006826800 [Elysia marginata]
MAPSRKRRVQLDTTNFLSVKKKKVDPIQKLQAKLKADLDHPYVQFYNGVNRDALSMTKPHILFTTPVHILKRLPICPKVLINLEDEDSEEDDDGDTRTVVIQRNVSTYKRQPICLSTDLANSEEDENSHDDEDTRTIIIRRTDEDGINVAVLDFQTGCLSSL